MEKPKLFSSLRISKSSKDLTTPIRNYPTREEDYDLIEACGQGATASVWRARCIPCDEEVAVKILDMERLNCKMEEVIHEAQAMCLYHHPNVLPLHTAFVVGKHLWFVEPFVKGGSVYNIMKFKHPTGLDEIPIAIIMKEVARALEYVHRCGGIHRDVKAGNILINTDGSVVLADFGVAATVERGGSWGNDAVNRKTFVGTPCWMAPEVMEQTAGYNSKADIWSFGITMLELANGHAPFSQFPPMKVLLMTIQNPPPKLESDLNHRHFSKHMKSLVADCLQKDPSKRPTASQILESKFFKSIPEPKYLATHLLDGLPPLAKREEILKERYAITKEDSQKANIRMKEDYVRGVSMWDFGDIMALKDSVNEAASHSVMHETKHDPSKEKADDTHEGPESNANQLLDKSHDVASSTKKEHAINPVQESVFSPSKKVSDSHHHDVHGDSTKLSMHEKNGKPSRFSVTTTKSSSTKKTTSPTVSETGAVLEAPTVPLHRTHSRGDDFGSNSASDLTEHDKESHESVYSKGRFRVHEQIIKKDEVKADKSRALTASNSQTSLGNAAIPSATALHDQLQSLLQSQKSMFSNLEQIVEALKEAEKGHPSPLQALLATKTGKGGHESQDSLLTKIKDLENENKYLKERITQLEKQVSSITIGNGPISEQS